jgi:hypothetical protein
VQIAGFDLIGETEAVQDVRHRLVQFFLLGWGKCLHGRIGDVWIRASLAKGQEKRNAPSGLAKAV